MKKSKGDNTISNKSNIKLPSEELVRLTQELSVYAKLYKAIGRDDIHQQISAGVKEIAIAIMSAQTMERLAIKGQSIDNH
jgi:hypothetical protein